MCLVLFFFHFQKITISSANQDSVYKCVISLTQTGRQYLQLSGLINLAFYPKMGPNNYRHNFICTFCTVTLYLDVLHSLSYLF